MTPSQSHSDAPPSRFRPRTAATIAAMVLLAALVAGGLALHFAHRDGHPGNSKSALRQIARHLKKHTG